MKLTKLALANASAGFAAYRAAHGSYVVMGVIEREGGTCYCTVLFFAPDGPTADDRDTWLPSI